MNIQGWDTVTVLSIDGANRSLAAAAGSLLSSFEFAGEVFGATYEGHGGFSSWRVVEGGSGELLRMALVIGSGTVRPGAAEPIDLAGLQAVVDVSLRLLPSSTGAEHDLVFDFGVAGRVGDTPRPGVVTPVALAGDGGVLAKLPEMGQTIVLNGIASSLCAGAAALSYTFAQVNLVPPGSGSWLAPVSAAYCYAERVDAPVGVPRGYLAILGVTTDRPVDGLARRVDPELLVGETGFAISEDLFLADVIRPALPAVFGGSASVDCFAYDATEHAIKQSRAFGIASVKEGLIWYDPRVTSLSVRVVGGALAMAVDGDCDLKAGISMTYWLTSQSQMTFDAATGRISFLSDPDPKSGHEADIPWWFILGGPLAEAITQLVVTVVTGYLADDLGGQLGAVGLSGLAARSVRWQGMRELDITDTRLDGALIITGKSD